MEDWHWWAEAHAWQRTPNPNHHTFLWQPDLNADLMAVLPKLNRSIIIFLEYDANSSAFEAAFISDPQG